MNDRVIHMYHGKNPKAPAGLTRDQKDMLRDLCVVPVPIHLLTRVMEGSKDKSLASMCIRDVIFYLSR